MKRPRNTRKSGFTLVEIMIVVAVIGLLSAIAIPNMVRARATSQANACIENLSKIDAAAAEWALDTAQTTGATCWLNASLGPYLNSNSMHLVAGEYQCPGGGFYVNPIALGTTPACTLSNTVTPAHVLQ